MKKLDAEDREYIEKGMLETANGDETFQLDEMLYVDTLLAEKDGYMLYMQDGGKGGFKYTVYRDEGDGVYSFVYSWVGYYNASLAKNIKTTVVYQTFLDCIEQDMFDDDFSYPADSDIDDEDTVYTSSSYPRSLSGKDNRKPKDKDWGAGYGGYANSWWGSYNYQPKPKKTGFFNDYTKSNTLVFHKTDSSTDMLAQIYEGKGWDVLRSTYDLDEDELFKVVDAHERIVCLGHGSSGGLIGMFGGEMAPHFKDKKLFVIWCNADGYFKANHIGEGQFITGNMPSEVWECRAAGCGSISKELMLENITYWSKLCADVAERCLEGDVKSSVDYIRKNYLEKYGNHPVTIYNSNRTQALGIEQPLPKFEFKGEPLTGADIPYEGYNQEEFLKNPTESIPSTGHSSYNYNSQYRYQPKTGAPVKNNPKLAYKQLSLWDDDMQDDSLTDADLERMGIKVVDSNKKVEKPN